MITKPDINIPESKTDGICHCPTINPEEVKDNIHIYCLGLIEDKLKIKKLKNNKKKKEDI